MYSKAWFHLKTRTVDAALKAREEIHKNHPNMKVHGFTIEEELNAIGELVGYYVVIGVTDGSLDE